MNFFSRSRYAVPSAVSGFAPAGVTRVAKNRSRRSWDLPSLFRPCEADPVDDVAHLRGAFDVRLFGVGDAEEGAQVERLGIGLRVAEREKPHHVVFVVDDGELCGRKGDSQPTRRTGSVYIIERDLERRGSLAGAAAGSGRGGHGSGSRSSGGRGGHDGDIWRIATGKRIMFSLLFVPESFRRSLEIDGPARKFPGESVSPESIVNPLR